MYRECTKLRNQSGIPCVPRKNERRGRNVYGWVKDDWVDCWVDEENDHHLYRTKMIKRGQIYPLIEVL